MICTPFFESIEASARSLKDWSFEWRIITPSGKLKWLHGVGRPQALASGGVAWNVFIIDITASRRVDTHLRDNNERFRQMLDGISNVSVQGYGMDLTTRYWNKASERLYGFTAKEAIGRNLLDLIIPEHMHDGVLAEVTRMIRTGKAIPEGDLTLKRKDGSPIEVFSSHAYVDMPGYEPELYCIDFDLTERREAETLRAQLGCQGGEGQKMEALGTLAGGIAHDFNNIVAAISGNVVLALNDLEIETPCAHQRAGNPNCQQKGQGTGAADSGVQPAPTCGTQRACGYAMCSKKPPTWCAPTCPRASRCACFASRKRRACWPTPPRSNRCCSTC